MGEAWRSAAACRNRTATMFDGDQQTEARSLCSGCPVEQVCLWSCLLEEDPNHRYGMAGGMSAGQRGALASRLPFAVVEAARDAALAAWQLRHGPAGVEPSAHGDEGWRPELGSSTPPSPTPSVPSTKENDPLTDEIITAVATAFGIAPEQLLGPSRTRHVVDARQVAMYVLREARHLSYPAVGAALGRDHTTAMHAVERVRARMAERPALRRGVERLLAAASAGLGTHEGVVVAPEERTPDLDGVLGEVARVCGVRVEQLCGRSRTRHVVDARQVAMYVLREARELSYPAIGHAVGGRDHTTVMHAVDRVRRAVAASGPLKDRVERAIAAVAAHVPVAA